MTLSSAPMQVLIDLLTGAGVSASLDPADVNLPGCWLALDSPVVGNVAGQLRLECTLYLIAPDTDPRRALDQLGELFGTVTGLVHPDGRVVTQGVVMPGDPTPLPALAVPVHLYESE